MFTDYYNWWQSLKYSVRRGARVHQVICIPLSLFCFFYRKKRVKN